MTKVSGYKDSRGSFHETFDEYLMAEKVVFFHSSMDEYYKEKHGDYHHRHDRDFSAWEFAKNADLIQSWLNKWDIRHAELLKDK